MAAQKDSRGVQEDTEGKHALAQSTMQLRLISKEDDQDLKILDKAGRELESNPRESMKAGSWNTLETYGEPAVAVRRFNIERAMKTLRQGIMSRAQLQSRLTTETETWACLAEAHVAPQIYGIRRYKRKMSSGDVLEVSSYVPRMYKYDLDTYIKKNTISEQHIESICEQLKSLAFKTADAGFCHLDLKLKNIVLDAEPLEVRFIDFDPEYMRAVTQDQSLIANLKQRLHVSRERACDTLRLFYVLLMLSWLLFALRKRHGEKRDWTSTRNRKAMRKHMRGILHNIEGPFRIFLETDLRTAGLVSLACARLKHYDKAKEVFNGLAPDPERLLEKLSAYTGHRLNLEDPLRYAGEAYPLNVPDEWKRACAAASAQQTSVATARTCVQFTHGKAPHAAHKIKELATKHTVAELQDMQRR